MGRSAKVTRGGNKQRVNVGRQKAKLEAKGIKDQTALALATAAAAAAKKQSSAKEAIAGTLRAIQRQREEQQAATAVKMAPRPQVGSGAALAAKRAATVQQQRKSVKATRSEKPSAAAMSAVPGYGFVLDDGVDWANAVPPGSGPPAAPPPTEGEAANAHNPTMIFTFPLPEAHPALQRPAPRPQRPPPRDVAPAVGRPSSNAVPYPRPGGFRAHGSPGSAGSSAAMAGTPSRERSSARLGPARARPQITPTPSPGPSPAGPRFGRRASQPEDDLEEVAVQRVLLQSTPPRPALSAASVDPSPPPRSPAPATPQPRTPPPRSTPRRNTSTGVGAALGATPRSAGPRSAGSGTRTPAQRTPALSTPGSLRGDRAPPGAAAGGEWELRDFSYEALLDLSSMAVSTGLSKEQLARYAPRPFAPEPGAPSAECTICLEEVSAGQPSLGIACGHLFHAACILQWLARTNRCPTCRFEIERARR